jgi:hypothetical protein
MLYKNCTRSSNTRAENKTVLEYKTKTFGNPRIEDGTGKFKLFFPLILQELSWSNEYKTYKRRGKVAWILNI